MPSFQYLILLLYVETAFFQIIFTYSSFKGVSIHSKKKKKEMLELPSKASNPPQSLPRTEQLIKASVPLMAEQEPKPEPKEVEENLDPPLIYKVLQHFFVFFLHSLYALIFLTLCVICHVLVLFYRRGFWKSPFIAKPARGKLNEFSRTLKVNFDVFFFFVLPLYLSRFVFVLRFSVLRIR